MEDHVISVQSRRARAPVHARPRPLRGTRTQASMKDNEVQTARMGMIFLFVFVAYYMIQDRSANLYGATQREHGGRR